MKNFKEIFKKIDFLIPFIIAIPLALNFYQQRFTWKCRVATYICPHNAILMAIAMLVIAYFASFVRWKFVYGDEKYREQIRKNWVMVKKRPPKKDFQFSWFLVVIFIILAVLFCREIYNKDYGNVAVLADLLFFFGSSLFLLMSPPKNKNYYFVPVFAIVALLVAIAVKLLLYQEYYKGILLLIISIFAPIILKAIIKITK